MIGNQLTHKAQTTTELRAVMLPNLFHATCYGHCHGPIENFRLYNYGCDVSGIKIKLTSTLIVPHIEKNYPSAEEVY